MSSWKFTQKLESYFAGTATGEGSAWGTFVAVANSGFIQISGHHLAEGGLMTTIELELKRGLIGLEWMARIASIVSIALLVLLFIGEGSHPSQVTAREWIGLLFFPVGITLGMIVAWWKEGPGAAITVGSLVAFYLVYGYLFGSHVGGWAFVTFTAPGFLFLLHWLLVHKRKKQILM
jgi:hypothetical protein